MKGLSLKLCIGVLVLVPAALLSAVYAENDRPVARQGAQGTIDITADKIQIKSRAGVEESVFNGNVTVKQGDVTLSCDKLVIVYDEKKERTAAENKDKKLTASTIKSITASGNVKITQNERKATADKAVWDYAKRTITLTEGPPRLWQGRDSISGHRIIMHLDENYSAIEYGGGPEWKPQKEKEK